MPEFTSRDLGGVNDKVTLRLGGSELLVAESYDVRMSFFRQPSIFALRTGWGGTALELMDRYPPNTKFELLIADHVQFTGRIDSVNAEQSAGATEVTFHGRDDLAPLHDSMAAADRSFDDASYEDVVTRCLEDAGVAEYTLIFENTQNRERRSGVVVPSTTNQTVFGRARRSATSAKKKAGQLKVGTQYYQFIKPELDRGGLFLFAAADVGDGPVFVMTEPNTTQPPRYKILGRRGELRNRVNTTSASFKNDTAKRFCEYVVFGRGGDPKNGQQSIQATYVDNEMLGYGFPRQRRRTARVDTVQTPDEALKLAWRMRAEDRRDSWNLTYVVSGHTVPALNGRTANDRAVWSADTTVEVDDDEYGISGVYYISDVQFQRDGSGTRTTLTLIDPADWVPP
jgi:prophage tail gpP-like protein